MEDGGGPAGGVECAALELRLRSTKLPGQRITVTPAFS